MDDREIINLLNNRDERAVEELGKRFGGRSHATVKHSIAWVEEQRRQDRIFHDRLETLRDNICDSAQ